MDEQFGVEVARLTANHPKRLTILARAGDLPWMTHWELLRRAAKAVDTTGLTRPVEISWAPSTPAVERAAIQAEAAALARVVAVLVLLSMAGRHKYPAAVLLALLWALGILSVAPRPVVRPAANAPPPRTVAPPGRLLVAQPCVARAPGRGVSLVDGSEGHAGLGALWGSAVLA
jgi:hypothetical protein